MCQYWSGVDPPLVHDTLVQETIQRVLELRRGHQGGVESAGNGLHRVQVRPGQRDRAGDPGRQALESGARAPEVATRRLDGCPTEIGRRAGENVPGRRQLATGPHADIGGQGHDEQEGPDRNQNDALL